MRVITGIARGRKLKTPDGLEVRPTSDRTKESIFNIIQFDIEGRRVLDLFAGSGQMGIEALSRGAAGAVFVDIRRECIDLIRENLGRTEFDSMSQVRQEDYRAYIKRAGKGSFGLIFLDPPYGERLLASAISMIMRRDLLCPGGLMVCEGEKNESLPDGVFPYEKGREYIYGKTKITVYLRKQEAI